VKDPTLQPAGPLKLSGESARLVTVASLLPRPDVKHLSLARSYTTKINVDAAHNYGYEDLEDVFSKGTQYGRNAALRRLVDVARRPYQLFNSLRQRFDSIEQILLAGDPDDLIP
jgi:hypothetical protein